MKLYDYSVEFSSKLFEAFPEFQEYMQIENYEKSKKAYFTIKVPCPSDTDSKLFISTYNEEIEIGFGFYHNHFSLDLEHYNEYEGAISLIEDILTEKQIIAMIKNENGLIYRTLKPDDLADLKKEDIISIYSWKGSYCHHE
ncbi:MAG TPA: hypothetical protein VIO64_09535 [Pseudobacteroides sp.]|uniref:hypothetical protein n=1 Tax=Pseudobacteroides sp. TaxID=1968840 RepID=UPI002F926E91